MTSNPNKPGKPANQSQHLVGDERGKRRGGKQREGLPSGENTPTAGEDVADPHPSQEEGYDRKSKIPTTGL